MKVDHNKYDTKSSKLIVNVDKIFTCIIILNVIISLFILLFAPLMRGTCKRNIKVNIKVNKTIIIFRNNYKSILRNTEN